MNHFPRKVTTNMALEKVAGWSRAVWTNAAALWSERPTQDHMYRKYVVEPRLSQLIPKLGLSPSSLVVEIGCGDGAHSFFWRKELNNLGLANVRIFGLDISEALILKARGNAVGYKNVSFEIADVTNINTAGMIHDAVGVPDVVVAMFLLQDLQDLEGVLRMVQATLRSGGHFIAVVVHPNFASRLADVGHLHKYNGADIPTKYVSDSGIVQWRYMGYYPIAQADRTPFYLPYFHRTVTDYNHALQTNRFDIVREISMMPYIDTETKDQVEPFHKTLWNVYWPYIVEEPSSLLIHAVCRGKRMH